MRNKKADFLTMDNIAIAILVLIVLIVLLVISRDFLAHSATGIKQIGEEAVGQGKGERCKSIFGVERRCFSNSCPQTKEDDQYMYEQVHGDFIDCPEKLPKGGFKKDDKGNVLNTCCERVRKEK